MIIIQTNDLFYLAFFLIFLIDILKNLDFAQFDPAINFYDFTSKRVNF